MLLQKGIAGGFRSKPWRWIGALVLGSLAFALAPRTAGAEGDEALVIRGAHVLKGGTNATNSIIEKVNFEMAIKTNGDWRIRTEFTNGITRTAAFVGGTPYHLTTAGTNEPGVGSVVIFKNRLLASSPEATRLIYTVFGRENLAMASFNLPVPFFDPLSPYLHAYSWVPEVSSFPPLLPNKIGFVVNSGLFGYGVSGIEYGLPFVKTKVPASQGTNDFFRTRGTPPSYETLSWTNVNDLTLPLEGALTYASPDDPPRTRRTSSFTVTNISFALIEDLRPAMSAGTKITHATPNGAYTYISPKGTWLTEGEARQIGNFFARLDVRKFPSLSGRDLLPVGGIILCLLWVALRTARAIMTREDEPRDAWFSLTRFKKSVGGSEGNTVGMSPIRAGPFAEAKEPHPNRDET